jgi:hypothetical protein
MDQARSNEQHGEPTDRPPPRWRRWLGRAVAIAADGTGLVAILDSGDETPTWVEVIAVLLRVTRSLV